MRSWGWPFAVAVAMSACDDDARTEAIASGDGAAAADASSDAPVEDASADADAGQPYVEPDKLGPPCGADAGVCPEEMTCARVSASNVPSEYTCIRGPVCDALVCPPGYSCLTNDKDLKDVYCYR